MIRSVIARAASVSCVALLATSMAAGTASAQAAEPTGSVAVNSLESTLENPVETAELSVVMSLGMPVLSINCVVLSSGCPE